MPKPRAPYGQIFSINKTAAVVDRGAREGTGNPMIGANHHRLFRGTVPVAPPGWILQSLRSRESRLNLTVSESTTILRPREQRWVRLGVDVRQRRRPYRRLQYGASGKYRSGKISCLEQGDRHRVYSMWSTASSLCTRGGTPERCFRSRWRWCTIGAPLVHHANGPANERGRDRTDCMVRNRDSFISLRTGRSRSVGAMMS